VDGRQHVIDRTGLGKCGHQPANPRAHLLGATVQSHRQRRWSFTLALVSITRKSYTRTGDHSANLYGARDHDPPRSVSADHIHLLVSCPPELSPAKIAQYLKGLRRVNCKMSFLTSRSAAGDATCGDEATSVRRPDQSLHRATSGRTAG
jgi:hypothetical protein